MKDVCDHLTELLEDLHALVAGLEAEVYRADAAGMSSVGRHVRHILDHLEALASAREGRVVYWRRTRGTAVETAPEAACAALLVARDWVEQWAGSPDRELQVRDMTGPRRGEAEVTCASSLRRELLWVASHTVHHLATLRFLLREARAEATLGAEVDLAPSTRHYEQGLAATPSQSRRGASCAP